MSLFRPQSLKSQDHLHGDVNLTQPLSWRLLAFSAIALIATLLGFSILYEMKDIAVYHGHVDMEDSAYRFKSESVEVSKREGVLVAKNDVLGKGPEGEYISPFDGVFHRENGFYKVTPLESKYRLKIEVPSNKANDFIGRKERFVFERGNSVEANLVSVSDDFHVKDGENFVYLYSDYISPVGYKVAPGMTVSFEMEIGKKPLFHMIFS